MGKQINKYRAIMHGVGVMHEDDACDIDPCLAAIQYQRGAYLKINGVFYKVLEIVVGDGCVDAIVTENEPPLFS